MAFLAEDAPTHLAHARIRVQQGVPDVEEDRSQLSGYSSQTATSSLCSGAAGGTAPGHPIATIVTMR